MDIFLWFVCNTLITPSWKQIFNQMSCPLKRSMGPWNWVLWESPRVCSRIRYAQFFEKINFLCFGGPQKTFLSPQNLTWPQKPHFWGVLPLKLKIYHKLYDSSKSIAMQSNLFRLSPVPSGKENWTNINFKVNLDNHIGNRAFKT